MDRLRDEYGNTVRQTDEYGNPDGPVQNQYSAGTMGAYDIGTGKHGGTHAGVPGYDPLMGTGTGTGPRYDTGIKPGTGSYDTGIGTGTGTGTGHRSGSYDTCLGMDGYGNPVRQTDEYGNLVGPVQNQYSAGTIGAYDVGTGKHGGGTHAGVPGYDPLTGTGTGTGYDTGTGPHYDTGINPGTGTYDTGIGTGTGTGHRGGSYDTGMGGGHQHQKKGIMEKIKDKLHGSHSKY